MRRARMHAGQGGESIASSSTFVSTIVSTLLPSIPSLLSLDQVVPIVARIRLEKFTGMQGEFLAAAAECRPLTDFDRPTVARIVPFLSSAACLLFRPVFLPRSTRSFSPCVALCRTSFHAPQVRVCLRTTHRGAKSDLATRDRSEENAAYRCSFWNTTSQSRRCDLDSAHATRSGWADARASCDAWCPTGLLALRHSRIALASHASPVRTQGDPGVFPTFSDRYPRGLAGIQASGRCW